MLVRFAPYLAAWLLLFSIYTYFIQLPGPNEVSRADLVLALVHDRTTAIDRFHVNTFDKARFGEHHYTDKAIGASLLGLPAYLAYQLFAGWPAWDGLRLDLVAWLVAAGGVAAPTAALVVLLFWWCRQQRLKALDAALIAGGYGLATPAFPFATMLFGHQTAAACLFGAFVLCWLVREGRAGAWAGAGAGALTGLAISSDYPAALAIVPFGLFLVTAEPGRRTLPAVIAGGLAGLAPLLAYNYASFGNPFRLAYEQIDDPASFAGATRGLFGVTVPTLGNIAELLVGPAGLLSRAPWLLLAPFGLLALRDRKQRPAALVLGAVALGFLLFNAAYYLPFGGVQTGPRFFLPALPFLVALLAYCRPVAVRLVSPVILASGIVALALTAVRSKVPSGVGEGQSDLFAYWLPRLFSGDLALSWGGLRYGLDGAWGLLPLGVLLLELGVVLALLRSGRPRASLAGLLIAVEAFALVSAPVGLPAAGRAPAIFRQTQPLPAGAPASLRFGDAIALLSADVAPLDARLDSDLRVTLRWTALTPPVESYTVFIHVLDGAGERIGQWDALPGAGAYPTLLWQPGRQVNDSYIVRLRRDVPLPTVATVHVGLYRFATLERLPASGPNGEPFGDAPAIARLRLAGPADPAPPDAPLVVFGGRLELRGATVVGPPAAGPPGSDRPSPARIEGRLRWRAAATLERDYHTSIQALGPAGVLGQSDARLAPRYPTSAWQPGEVVEQPFALELPAGLADQLQRLIVVVYDPATGERLPTPGGDFFELPR